MSLFHFFFHCTCRAMNKEIYHLWHPNNKQQGNPNYQNNYTLLRKYFETKGDIQKLKKLIINRQN